MSNYNKGNRFGRIIADRRAEEQADSPLATFGKALGEMLFSTPPRKPEPICQQTFNGHKCGGPAGHGGQGHVCGNCDVAWREQPSHHLN